jgi:sugar phosphate permease
VRSVAALAVAEVLAMSLWFVSAAILPEMVAEGGLGPARAAALSSAVQIGFVVGALALAIHGTADRCDPRRVFVAAGLAAAAANLALLVAPVGGAAQIVLRGVTGACLAGVYPVGMKIVIGWGIRDRGLLVGLLVGALTVGSALPHLLAVVGGAEWRATVVAASALAAAGAVLANAAVAGRKIEALLAALLPRV